MYLAIPRTDAAFPVSLKALPPPLGIPGPFGYTYHPPIMLSDLPTLPNLPPPNLVEPPRVPELCHPRPQVAPPAPPSPHLRPMSPHAPPPQVPPPEPTQENVQARKRAREESELPSQEEGKLFDMNAIPILFSGRCNLKFLRIICDDISPFKNDTIGITGDLLREVLKDARSRGLVMPGIFYQDYTGGMVLFMRKPRLVKMYLEIYRADINQLAKPISHETRVRLIGKYPFLQEWYRLSMLVPIPPRINRPTRPLPRLSMSSNGGPRVLPKVEPDNQQSLME